MATTITASYTGGPTLIQLGGQPLEFTLSFPGATTLINNGGTVVSATIQFTFSNDSPGSGDLADVIIWDSTPEAWVLDNAPVMGSPTTTTYTVPWYPNSIIAQVGGGTTTGAAVFGWITNGSDDWDFGVSAASGSAGDFYLDGATVTLDIVPEPTSFLLIGTGLFGLGLLRKRILSARK